MKYPRYLVGRLTLNYLEMFSGVFRSHHCESMGADSETHTNWCSIQLLSFKKYRLWNQYCTAEEPSDDNNCKMETYLDTGGSSPPPHPHPHPENIDRTSPSNEKPSSRWACKASEALTADWPGELISEFWKFHTAGLHGDLNAVLLTAHVRVRICTMFLDVPNQTFFHL